MNVLDHGILPGYQDNTEAFNDLIESITSEATLYFPSGQYRFFSAPNPINKTVNIIGDGPAGTELIRSYTGDTFLHFLRSSKVENLSIIASENTESGSAIKLEGIHCSNSTLRDVFISGRKGTWDTPVHLTSDHPLGIRTCRIDNLNIFAATKELMLLDNVKGLMADFSAYPANGTVSHIDIRRSNKIFIKTRHLIEAKISNTVNWRIDSINKVKVPFKEKLKAFIRKHF